MEISSFYSHSLEGEVEISSFYSHSLEGEVEISSVARDGDNTGREALAPAEEKKKVRK